MCQNIKTYIKNEGIRKFLTEEQIANLPAQDGGRSWAFDPYLHLTYEDAHNLVDLMLDDLCVEWMKEFHRKPSADTQQKFLDCASVIVANLLHAHCNGERTTVGIYRSKGCLERTKRYRPEYMTANRLIAVQNSLIKAGHIEIVQRGFNIPSHSQTTRIALTKGAAVKLRAGDLSFADFTTKPFGEVIRLKDKSGCLCHYIDTPETNKMRENILKINGMLATTDISTTRTLGIYDRNSEYQGRNVHLYRVFNNNTFDHGGRFYGGWWQNIRSHARQLITLDGQNTIEADFRGFNPSVLLAESGRHIPADPYSPIMVLDGSIELRNHAKITLAALLNSKRGNTDEPKNFDSQKYGMTADDFREKVLDAFPMVQNLLGTNKGMQLQRRESELAEKIMLHFVEKGYPILPIHDAFIVQAPLKSELVSIMKTTFKSIWGQTPQVKITPSQVRDSPNV